MRARKLGKVKVRRGGTSPWLVTGSLVALTLGGASLSSAAAPPGGTGKERPVDGRAPGTILPYFLPTRRFESSDSVTAPERFEVLPPGRVAPQDESAPVPFDIRPGSLREVLDRFHDATGWDVEVVDVALLDIPSPGVSGLYTPRQALDALLAATSIRVESYEPGRALLGLGVSEVVNVVGTEVVTPSSPKYTEPLRNIPQTITIVPQKIIQEQNATTLRDVLRNVTGISVQAGEGGVPAGDNLSIRGFSARTDIFVDGLRDFGGYSRDPFNTEQVEVVKGPSSAVAGRGSTGGSVNLVTKAPNLQSVQNASFGAGNADYKRGTIDFNVPVERLGDSVAVRLNAMWTDANVPGRDVASNSRWGFAPSFGAGIGSATRFVASYSHLNQDNVPDYGIPWVPADNVPLAEFADQPAPVDFRNFYGLVSRDYENTSTDIATADFAHDFSRSLTLRNVFRYGTTYRDSLITAPRFLSADSTDIRRTDWKSRDQTDDIVADQLNLTAYFDTASVRHTAVAGIELDREGSVNDNRVETGPEAPATDLFHPNPNDPYSGSLVRDGAYTEGDATTTAAYLFDTVDLDEKWQLTGGLRWEQFATDYIAYDADGTSSPAGRTDDMLSWRAGVVFKPRPNGSVYFGAGTSFNPSAEGLSLGGRTPLADVEPEKGRSIEVGTKWDFARGLSLSTAVFSTLKTNARTPGIGPGDPPTVLDGKQRVSGFELGVSGNPARGWTLFGGYTFMKSEILDSNNADEVGNQFGNTPGNTFSLWSSHEIGSGVEVGGGVNYVGNRYNNTNGARLAPGYWLVDAMASYRVNEYLTLRMNVNNLTDARHVDRVGGGHFIPGDGRSIALTADVRF